MDDDGKELHLEKKKNAHLSKPVTVYNFAVGDYHTYFVGENEVLVHNMCAANSDKDGIKNVYNSIKDAPNYPKDFYSKSRRHNKKYYK